MACEIDFNPVTLSSRGMVDNLGENLVGTDRSPQISVQQLGESWCVCVCVAVLFNQL